MILQVNIGGFREFLVDFNGLDDLRFERRRSFGKFMSDGRDDEACIAGVLGCTRAEEAVPAIPTSQSTLLLVSSIAHASKSARIFTRVPSMQLVGSP